MRWPETLAKAEEQRGHLGTIWGALEEPLQQLDEDWRGDVDPPPAAELAAGADGRGGVGRERRARERGGSSRGVEERGFDSRSCGVVIGPDSTDPLRSAGPLEMVLRREHRTCEVLPIERLSNWHFQLPPAGGELGI